MYPFVAGNDIENAAKGLHLGEEISKFSSSHILKLQQQKVTPRSSYAIMHQSDFDKLDPGQCLNDAVVDFWTLGKLGRKLQMSLTLGSLLPNSIPQ